MWLRGALVIAIGSSVLLAGGQSIDQPDSLTIVSTSQDGAIELKNTSNKTIVAYVVRWQTGSTAQNASSSTKCNLAVKAGLKVWNPGDIISDQLNASQQGFKPTIDYVRFKDNSQVGPDLCKMAGEIRNLVMATDAERRRLRQIRDEKGGQALSDDLDDK